MKNAASKPIFTTIVIGGTGINRNSYAEVNLSPP